MSAEVPEAASAEEQKVSECALRAAPAAREAQRRGCRGPGLPGGLLSPRAGGASGVGSERLERRAGGAGAPAPAWPCSLPRRLPAGAVVPAPAWWEFEHWPRPR